jgi:hypothetical protein
MRYGFKSSRGAIRGTGCVFAGFETMAIQYSFSERCGELDAAIARAEPVAYAHARRIEV